MLLDLLPLFDETTTTGGSRRHMGKSGAQPRQIQRPVRFRWQFTYTATGQVIAAITAPVPAFTATGHITATSTTPTPTMRAHGHITHRTHYATPTVRVFDPNLDEELLLILDLL